MFARRRLSILSTTAGVLLCSLLLLRSRCDARENSVEGNNFNEYWKDANVVLDNLDKYQALWVKVHGCVWSECSVDNNDDDGENRDGDEYWYEYRTQEFCANAAYSLYGIKKNHISINHCSRGNFINSFFTYGGADLILAALGKTAEQYLDDDGYSNSYCSSSGNNNEQRRDLGNNNAYYGTSTTLGCTASGEFGMASFRGQYCDGNSFQEIIDPMTPYNKAMNHVRCNKIWGRGVFSGSTDAVATLLSNSWSCDLDLYPNGCPDPYGIKQRNANVMRAISNGQSPRLAIWNYRLKRPIRMLAWLLFLAGLLLLVYGHLMKHEDFVKAKGWKAYLGKVGADVQKTVKGWMLRMCTGRQCGCFPRQKPRTPRTPRRGRKRSKRSKRSAGSSKSSKSSRSSKSRERTPPSSPTSSADEEEGL